MIFRVEWEITRSFAIKFSPLTNYSLDGENSIHITFPGSLIFFSELCILWFSLPTERFHFGMNESNRQKLDVWWVITLCMLDRGLRKSSSSPKHSCRLVKWLKEQQKQFLHDANRSSKRWCHFCFIQIQRSHRIHFHSLTAIDSWCVI